MEYDELLKRLESVWTQDEQGRVNVAVSRQLCSDAIAAIRSLQERVLKLERLDAEAATHVESLICMRSKHFTAKPPYVGWKGLGLALSQDYDDFAVKMWAEPPINPLSALTSLENDNAASS